MDRLNELINEYPDTAIIEPSCGAKVVYAVLELFEKDPVSLDLLEYAIDSDNNTKETSLLNIKGHLESSGLHTLALRSELLEVERIFDSYVSVIHTKSSNQNLEQVSPNHFEVLIKKGNTYISIDSPSHKTFKVLNEGDTQNMSDELGYAQTILIVSDKPVKINEQHNSISIITILIVIFVMVFMVLRKKRKADV